MCVKDILFVHYVQKRKDERVGVCTLSACRLPLVHHWMKVGAAFLSTTSFSLLLCSLSSSLLSPSVYSLCVVSLLSPFSPHLALALALHLHLLPVVTSSLSPTPSFAPRTSSLLHGLASSLSLGLFISMSKSHPFIFPQTLLVEEDRRKRGEEHTGTQLLLVHKFNCKQWEYYINSDRGDNSLCFGRLVKRLFHSQHPKCILMLN